MTRALPPLAPVSVLVHRVIGAAAHGISEGSRRNARGALEARHDLTCHGTEVLAALSVRDTHARRASAAS